MLKGESLIKNHSKSEKAVQPPGYDTESIIYLVFGGKYNNGT